MIFPGLVREHVKQCASGSDFLYVTSTEKSFYEKQTGFIHVDVPNIPRQDETKLSVDQIKMMKAYKARFLQGVQQNSIRNTRTKN